jgi:hypothetical protein
MRFNKAISHWYAVRRDLYLETIRSFIVDSKKLMLLSMRKS